MLFVRNGETGEGIQKLDSADGGQAVSRLAVDGWQSVISLPIVMFQTAASRSSAMGTSAAQEGYRRKLDGEG